VKDVEGLAGNPDGALTRIVPVVAIIEAKKHEVLRHVIDVSLAALDGR
jgi:hypothetical protein